jgi:hypothetical protein
MTKDEAKLAYALVTLYTNLYKNVYNRDPKVNKHRDKWAMQDVIDSVGYERAKQIMEYYFKITKPGHPMNWFLYNFDRLDDVMTKKQEDELRRQKLREQTKRMVEENE